MRPLFIALVLLCSTALGQVDLQVTKYQQVTGLKNPIQIGTSIYVEKLDGQVGTKPVALLFAKSETKNPDLRVDATDVQRSPVALEKVDNNVYLLEAPGRTWVEVKEYIEIEIGGVKRKLLADSKTVVVELGPPPPPPVPPAPPVPPDEFNNLGQRVAQWTVGLPKRKELAAVYKAGAEKLKNDLKATINQVTGEVVAQRSSVLGAEYSQYSKFISQLQADFDPRKPMDKSVLRSYYIAIALGLEAQ